MSYLANHFHTPLIAYVAPLIAFSAIAKSFFGHYLGAREGLHGLVAKSLRSRGKEISSNGIHRLIEVFMIITCVTVATLNPSILGMIEVLGGPIIAVILFLMPMYAIATVPGMKKYRNARSNLFVSAIGIVTLSAIFYSLFR